MGNSVAAQQRAMFEAGRFAELRSNLDLTQSSGVLVNAAALFAEGDLDTFLAFTAGERERNAPAMTEDRLVAAAGLGVAGALVRFILLGGLTGAREPADEAIPWLEEGLEALGSTQLGSSPLGREYKSLYDAGFLMIRGHAGSGDVLLLRTAVDKLTFLQRAPADRDAMHFLPQFFGTILHGLCSLTLFRLTKDPKCLRASEGSGRRVFPLLPPQHVLRDLWLVELRALDVWEALGALPAHANRCTAVPGPLGWATIGDVFVGQPRVIDALRLTFEQRRRNLLPSDRPLVLWFSGGSGHGKTYLAQLIAEVLHGTDGSPQEAGKLIVINCQNLRTAESVNSLVDPPTGIKGEGPLIAGLEKHPDAVVLLDELDKAKVDAVESVFLPAFERDGYLRSAKDGRVVRTARAVFVITSNYGADTIDRDAAEYTAGTPECRARLEDRWRTSIITKLQESYTPPFTNRATSNLFVFTPYTREESEKAVDLELGRWARHLATDGRLLVQWTRGVNAHFVDRFHQFHGQKMVTACAAALNASLTATPTARCFLLVLRDDGAVAAVPVSAAVDEFRPSPSGLRACLPSELTGEPDTPLPPPDALVARLLAATPFNDPAPPPPIPHSTISPTSPPALAPPLVPLVSAPASRIPTGRTMKVPSRPTESDLEAERDPVTDAEVETLRHHVLALRTENAALLETVRDRDAAIESLTHYVNQLQIVLTANLALVCSLLWIITWLVPTNLLVFGLIVAAVVAGALWSTLSPWLVPVFRALRYVLGDNGALALAAMVVMLLAHRLQRGPLHLGC